MNKLKALITRNLKEIIRDPLSSVFCIGFPVIMLVLMQLLFGQMKGVPDMFNIGQFAPGICVFGYTFSMLFVAMIITHDNNTQFVNRLNIAPIKKTTYIFSYVLAILPIILVQTILFFAIALIFGLTLNSNTLLSVPCLLLSGIMFVMIGVLLGFVTKSEKHIGPICSIIISLSAMLGGIFMPVQNMGAFSSIANALPFLHSVQLGAAALNGENLLVHLLVVVGYTLLFALLAYLLLKRKK